MSIHLEVCMCRSTSGGSTPAEEEGFHPVQAIIGFIHIESGTYIQSI